MTRIVLSIFCSALVLVVLGKMACALLYNPALILQPQPAWQVKKCFSCSQKRFEWAHTSSSHLQPEPLLSKIPRSVQLMGGTTTVWNHYWSSQWSFCIRATLPYYSLVQACLGILVCLLHYEGGGRDWWGKKGGRSWTRVGFCGGGGLFFCFFVVLCTCLLACLLACMSLLFQAWLMTRACCAAHFFLMFVLFVEYFGDLSP